MCLHTKTRNVPCSRVHLHAMRHSCAHSLARRGNSSKQISLVLGHRSEKVTNDIYLRESTENIVEGIRVPSHWAATGKDEVASSSTVLQQKEEKNTLPVDADPEDNKVQRCSKKQRVSTKTLMMRALEAFEAEDD